MRVIVVGAGAWGLPAAAQLARRGHQVTLLDRHGAAHQLGSSSGPTRLWRLSHPDRPRVRLARRSEEAWHRLERDSGITAILYRGLLWRDDVSAPLVAESLAAEDVPHTVVDPADVGRFFPGLRADGRAAVWQDTAGPVLARAAMDAQAALFAMAGGRISVGHVVREVDTTGDGVRLGCECGSPHDADVVVLAPGAGAGGLLAALGIQVEMLPVLEQVCHVGRAPATDAMACLYDGPQNTEAQGDEPGMYAMPTPGRGYKLGIDLPLRVWTEGDDDRVPRPEVSRMISERVVRNFSDLDPTVLDAQVCTWTDSPDGRFVVDAVAGGRVVVACGDSGEGFKFSALMGEVLADRAEGIEPDADVAAFGLARFGDQPARVDAPHVLGR